MTVTTDNRDFEKNISFSGLSRLNRVDDPFLLYR